MRKKEKKKHTHTIVCPRSDFVFRYNGGDGPEKMLSFLQCSSSSKHICV